MDIGSRALLYKTEINKIANSLGFLEVPLDKSIVSNPNEGNFIDIAQWKRPEDGDKPIGFFFWENLEKPKEDENRFAGMLSREEYDDEVPLRKALNPEIWKDFFKPLDDDLNSVSESQNFERSQDPMVNAKIGRKRNIPKYYPGIFKEIMSSVHNHPEIYSIYHEIREILEEQGFNGSLGSYYEYYDQFENDLDDYGIAGVEHKINLMKKAIIDDIIDKFVWQEESKRELLKWIFYFIVTDDHFNDKKIEDEIEGVIKKDQEIKENLNFEKLHSKKSFGMGMEEIIKKELEEDEMNLKKREDILLWAAESNRKNIVKYLIDSGVDVTYHQNNALVKATLFHNDDIIRLLLDAGANIEEALSWFTSNTNKKYLESFRPII